MSASSTISPAAACSTTSTGCARLPGSRRLEIVQGDVRDAAAVAKAARDATEIYHLAAQVAVTTSVDDPRTDFEVNALGTFNVLEAARRSRPQSFPALHLHQQGLWLA